MDVLVLIAFADQGRARGRVEFLEVEDDVVGLGDGFVFDRDEVRLLFESAFDLFLDLLVGDLIHQGIDRLAGEVLQDDFGAHAKVDDGVEVAVHLIIKFGILGWPSTSCSSELSTRSS